MAYRDIFSGLNILRGLIPPAQPPVTGGIGAGLIKQKPRQRPNIQLGGYETVSPGPSGTTLPAPKPSPNTRPAMAGIADAYTATGKQPKPGSVQAAVAGFGDTTNIT